MSDDETNCLVAKCACGEGLIFAAVDLPERRKENAKEVAALIRKGFRIDNMPVAAVRRMKFHFKGDCKAPTS